MKIVVNYKHVAGDLKFLYSIGKFWTHNNKKMTGYVYKNFKGHQEKFEAIVIGSGIGGVGCGFIAG